MPTSSFPAARLVFVQYLFGLAVVKACRDDKILGSNKGKNVKLKWPNDIYIGLGGEGDELITKRGINTALDHSYIRGRMAL